MSNAEIQNAFYTRIQLERKRQEEKHGDGEGTVRSMSFEQWLPILVEEVGEVATAIMDFGMATRNHFFSGKGINSVAVVEHELISELVQVAAVCMAMYEDIMTRKDIV